MNELITPDEFVKGVSETIEAHAKDCDDPAAFRIACMEWLQGVIGRFPQPEDK